jgi:hypothetical protein
MPRITYQRVISEDGSVWAVQEWDKRRRRREYCIGCVMGCVKPANDTEEFWEAYLASHVGCVQVDWDMCLARVVRTRGSL